MITIKDIADKAGVAKSTVSRYLNGGSISPSTAKKIQEIIDHYNYVPNTFAQSLKAKNSRLIGVIMPRLDSRASITTLEGIDSEAQKQEYQLLIANTKQDREEEVRRIYSFAKEKVSGIIIMATIITEEHLQAIADVSLPTIFIGQEHPKVHSVIHDDYQASRQFTKELLQNGHRKITYFGVSEEDHAVGVLRKQGVLDAVKEQAEAEIEVIETSFHMIDSLEKGMELLPKTQSTLWIAATDNIAVGLLKAAHILDVNVPSQLSLTGFGGYDVSDYVFPSLSTVHFRYFDAGEQAMMYLNQMIQGEEVPLKTIMGYDIYHRDSVNYLPGTS